ncbi:hypothetical protein GCM10027521_24760 [Amycolatopsis cihanbeyliensis]
MRGTAPGARHNTSASYGVFLGLDVGKGEHHALGLDPTGNRLHDAPLPNSEPKLREMFEWLAQHGPILVGPVSRDR